MPNPRTIPAVGNWTEIQTETPPAAGSCPSLKFPSYRRPAAAAPQRPFPGTTPEERAGGYAAKLQSGRFDEPLTRAVLYVTAIERTPDQRSAFALNVARQLLMHLSLAAFKTLVRKQFFVLQRDHRSPSVATGSVLKTSALPGPFRQSAGDVRPDADLRAEMPGHRVVIDRPAGCGGPPGDPAVAGRTDPALPYPRGGPIGRPSGESRINPRSGGT